MNAAGFYLGETGGGCTAYSRQEPDSTVFLITRADDVDAPESLEDPCTVGKIDPDGEWSLVGNSADVRAALVLVSG